MIELAGFAHAQKAITINQHAEVVWRWYKPGL